MRFIFTFITACMLAFTINAQDETVRENGQRGKRRANMESKMESQRIAFITKELDLTPSQAQNFWPIYNEYRDKKKTFRIEHRKEMNNGEITDAEAKEFLKSIFENEQKELDLKRDYFKRMESAIPPKKIAHLFHIEQKFRTEVFNFIKKRMNGKERKQRKNGY